MWDVVDRIRKGKEDRTAVQACKGKGGYHKLNKIHKGEEGRETKVLIEGYKEVVEKLKADSLDCNHFGECVWGLPLSNQSFKKKSKVKNKRVLVLADSHSGAISGCTPPEYWVNKHSNPVMRPIQEECWKFYSDTVKEIGPVDVVIANGDCIDGKGKKSGGTEQITSDLIVQTKIAIRCLQEIPSFDRLFITHGTAYHTSSSGEDFETLIAEAFPKQRGTIKDHLFLDVNGCMFDVKHHVGSSSVMSSRTGAIIKAVEWNQKWAKRGMEPLAHVLIRSHVHVYMQASDAETFIAMTTPALQSPDTKFGNRICQGTVDFGMILFEIPEDYKEIQDVKYKVYKKNLLSSTNRSEVI